MSMQGNMLINAMKSKRMWNYDKDAESELNVIKIAFKSHKVKVNITIKIKEYCNKRKMVIIVIQAAKKLNSGKGQDTG